MVAEVLILHIVSVRLLQTFNLSRFNQALGDRTLTYEIIERRVTQLTYQDKSLTCSDCGSTFSFTAAEQEFYNSKGLLNEPKRCSDCRRSRRSGQGGGGSGGRSTANRQMFPVVCSQCGKQTEVPFEPRGDKPVYCSDCFRKTDRTR